MDLSNISILNLMPQNLAADKNIRLMAKAFDEVLQDIIKKIPDIEMIPNLTLNKIMDEMIIDLLAWQFHVDFYDPGLPVEIKRKLVLKSLDWHYRKGTPSVVEEIVSAVFTRAEVQDWYEYGGRPYRFRIATEGQIPDGEAMKKLMRAINSVKNTRSSLDALTNLLDFIEDKIEMDERVVIGAVADFVEEMESHDIFEILSELSFVDHVYGRSAIVYGGGIEGGAQYNGVYPHNGQIAYQREVFRYTHDGEIVFGSGLSDVFASEDFEAALRIDFSEEMPSRDELAITCIADHTDRFSSARLYDSKMSHNGQYKWDASDDFLEVIPITDGNLVDAANIEDGAIETELLADFIDAAEMNEAVDPHTITLDMQDTAGVDEELVLAGNMDFSDTAEMDDEFAVSMIGYWTYGGSDNPQYNHDGSIEFNYGEIVPV
ncbi:MAG: phage tail protein I [Proteiniphilum sp.]|jgi:phage tail P2-like protein|nr:phage tail protein I [Proteiniphilum sp.]